MRLGELIKTKRETAGMSLQELADVVGVSKAHVWDLEQGKTENPSLMLTLKLSVALGVPVNAFAATLLKGAP